MDKAKMILLNDEECFDAVSIRPMGEDEDWQLAKAVAKAQLKKVVEELWASWVKEDSPALLTLVKHSKAWHSLLKEVE